MEQNSHKMSSYRIKSTLKMGSKEELIIAEGRHYLQGNSIKRKKNTSKKTIRKANACMCTE